MERPQGQPVGFRSSPRRVAIEIAIIVGGLALLVFGGVMCASRAAGCAVRFVPMSVDEKLGAHAFPQLAPASLRCTDPGPKAYVEAIAAELVRHCDDCEFTLTVEVIDRPEVNAAALPGGYVAVHMGLLRAAEGGDEIAGVLAHELQHAAQRHGVKRVLRKIGGFAVVGLVLGWTDLGVIVSYASDLVDLGYDRDQEREADRKGRDILAKANIDPRGMARFFERLKGEAGARVPLILSSHPDLDERAREAAAAATGGPYRELPPPPAELKCR